MQAKYFLLLLPTLMMILACHPDEDASCDTTQSNVVPMICELATKMNVFPVCIIAKGGGPLYKKEKRPFERRYEVTFDQYELFYNLKFLGLTATVKDLDEAIAYLDRATPKEKALILTMIYVYERTHREPKNWKMLGDATLDYYYDYPPMLPRMKADKTISRRQWKKWINVLKQYSEDDTVAFPAITGDEKTMKEAWEQDRLKAINMARTLGMIDPIKEAEKKKTRAESYEKDARRFYGSFDKSELQHFELQILPYFEVLDLDWTRGARNGATTEVRKKIDALTEFLRTQEYILPLSGIAYLRGNSSKEPKTVGDIATQLLRSRLPYDDDEK